MSEQGKFYLVMAGIIAALAMIGGGGVMAYQHYKQRGIRNNNPGNVDYSEANKWQGMTGNDGRFAIFKAPEWGIRALYKTLLTYRNKHGLSTVAGIIHRWAPTVENDTEAYVAAVAKAVGKAPGVPLELADYPALVKAIIKHENGVQPYPDSLIQKGIALA